MDFDPICQEHARLTEIAGVLFSIMKRFEFRELLRENLHVAVHEALKEVTTDVREFFKYTAAISILRIASFS